MARALESGIRGGFFRFVRRASERRAGGARQDEEETEDEEEDEKKVRRIFPWHVAGFTP